MNLNAEHKHDSLRNDRVIGFGLVLWAIPFISKIICLTFVWARFPVYGYEYFLIYYWNEKSKKERTTNEFFFSVFQSFFSDHWLRCHGHAYNIGPKRSDTHLNHFSSHAFDWVDFCFVFFWYACVVFIWVSFGNNIYSMKVFHLVWQHNDFELLNLELCIISRGFGRRIISLINRWNVYAYASTILDTFSAFLSKTKRFTPVKWLKMFK